ncbi:MAG: hypothetical protein JZU49_00250, partial [Sulfuricurvum sp.]|nr:hypothetical protein [Sulfuricurvum sp.]
MIQLQEEELKTQDPAFWNNPKDAEAQMKVVRSIKVWTDGFKQVDQTMEDLLVLYDFFEMDEATEE